MNIKTLVWKNQSTSNAEWLLVVDGQSGTSGIMAPGSSYTQDNSNITEGNVTDGGEYMGFINFNGTVVVTVPSGTDNSMTLTAYDPSDKTKPFKL